MKAVILAGGQGGRIRPISASVPKPMIPVVSKPILEFVIDFLRTHGFDEIIISTSYLPHHIENHFRDGSRFGVQLAYSFEGHQIDGRSISEGLGAAGALKKIQDFSAFFDDTFAVVVGDGIFDLDLRQTLAFHRLKHSIATLVLQDVPREDVVKYGIVRVDADGRILQFQEKPSPADAISTTVNTGVYLFEPDVFRHIPSGRPVDIARELFPQLAAGGLPLYGITQPLTWIDIGSTADYWRATQMILRGDLPFVDLPGHALAPGIRGGINLDLDLSTCDIRGPVYIGSSTRIEPGVTIVGPTAVGRNCHLESGAFLDRCVVSDYTRISGLANLREKVVSGRFCVDRFGVNVDLASTGHAFLIDDARERRQWSEEQQALMAFLRVQPSS